MGHRHRVRNRDRCIFGSTLPKLTPTLRPPLFPRVMLPCETIIEPGTSSVFSSTMSENDKPATATEPTSNVTVYSIVSPGSTRSFPFSSSARTSIVSAVGSGVSAAKDVQLFAIWAREAAFATGDEDQLVVDLSESEWRRNHQCRQRCLQQALFRLPCRPSSKAR